ncbi:MAG: methyltransferase domain-containing protein [Myxococcota bacterium]
MAWSPALFDAAHAVRPAANVEAVVYTALAEALGGPVLEMGCGTARVLLAMLRANVDADGVEVDRAMAAAGQRKLTEAGLSPARIVVGDMLHHRPTRRYRVVVLPSNTIGSVRTGPELQQLFATVRACLLPRGYVAFDRTLAPAAPTPPFEADVTVVQRESTRPARYTQRVRYDESAQLELVTERFEFADGECTELEHRLRVWSSRAVARAYSDHGLVSAGPAVDAGGAPLSASSRVAFHRLQRV